ncbi:MAG TPA: hypothetical protein VN151_08740 [Terracidiphilus sp.]|nr:hypothetical protein [Terracidiphilus sp.]
MSLLQQDGLKAQDDAARGEELTRGSSHLTVAALTATVLVTLAIALYVFLGEKPPVATGEVVEVWAHPMHTVTPAFDANGDDRSQTSFDQVLVFTHVRLRNQSQQPLFLHEILTNVTGQDGSIDSSTATTASQYERVFVAYQDLAQWKAPALKTTDLDLAPGQTVEGTFVSSFRMTRQQWEARKALDFTANFRYQKPVKFAPKAAVVER